MSNGVYGMVDDGGHLEGTEPSYDSSIAENSLVIASDSKKLSNGYDWINRIRDDAFPPEHMQLIRVFERTPDRAFMQSYRDGQLLKDIDDTAPRLRIAITFLEGADKPTVMQAELSKVNEQEAPQKTHEWRVATAAHLLKKVEVGDDLSFHQKDESRRVVEQHRKRQKLIKSTAGVDKYEESPSRSRTKTFADLEVVQAAFTPGRRDDTVVTICSDHVKLFHNHSYGKFGPDISCTLIEIDFNSMRNLMFNFRTIIQDGGRNVSAKEILKVLDVMINDVRRLCTRSSRLFQMSTRSLIAESKNTRYGVSYGNVFATITTSEGISKYIEKSSAYYLSLAENVSEQEQIRPKFLQMLVLLLSFLNNDDLKRIEHMLESTFHIPGDRFSLELLILKVLPLSAINPEVFLCSLYAACRPNESKSTYQATVQAKIWQELQQDLARKGFFTPVQIENSSNSRRTGEDAQDLEAMLESVELEPEYTATGGSWLLQWPDRGFQTSSVFKYLQHDLFTRAEGDSKQMPFRAINEIPHLVTSPEDSDNKVLVELTNGSQYRLASDQPELISALQKDTYVLRAKDNDARLDLEVNEEILNDSAVEATSSLNHLLDKIKAYYRLQEQKRRLLSSKSTPQLFAPLDEPALARRVWAEVIQPSGERERLAVTYKIGNQIMDLDDVLREMKRSTAELQQGIEHLQKLVEKFSVSKLDSEAARLQQSHIETLRESLSGIINNTTLAKNKRLALQRGANNWPTDPIAKVIYPSLSQVADERTEWQHHQLQLSRDGNLLIIKSARLEVQTVSQQANDVLKLTFSDSPLSIYVEPLASTASDAPSNNSTEISRGDSVLLLGHYICVVEMEDRSNPRYGALLGYFHIVGQQRLPPGKGNRATPPQRLTVLAHQS